MASKYTKGVKVWVRPRLEDNPIKATYVRCVTDEETAQGYRSGEIVKLENGNELWVRSDLCSFIYEELKDKTN